MWTLPPTSVSFLAFFTIMAVFIANSKYKYMMLKRSNLYRQGKHWSLFLSRGMSKFRNNLIIAVRPLLCTKKSLTYLLNKDMPGTLSNAEQKYKKFKDSLQSSGMKWGKEPYFFLSWIFLGDKVEAIGLDNGIDAQGLAEARPDSLHFTDSLIDSIEFPSTGYTHVKHKVLVHSRVLVRYKLCLGYNCVYCMYLKYIPFETKHLDFSIKHSCSSASHGHDGNSNCQWNKEGFSTSCANVKKLSNIVETL